MIVCGIDPGLSGGIAFIGGDPSAYRVPIKTQKIGKKTKRYLDLVSIIKLLQDKKPDVVYIEKQQAMPRQGVSSTFQTGFGYGIYIGLLVALNIKFVQVSPAMWKKTLEVSKDKDLARARATELIPDLSHKWQKKVEDGVAEAAMIAYFGLSWGQSPNGSK